MDDETLATLRYCFQRILVPIVVIIGIFGNFISVLVLTRRRMRCSTNIYLTALAVADIIYLLFIYVLSLQHYPNINHSKYRLYWSTIGLSHWFCDATFVVFLCFLLTISTAFEYKLSQKFVYVNPFTHKSCPENWQNITLTNLMDTNKSISDDRNELSPIAEAIIAKKIKRQINAMSAVEHTTMIIIPNEDDDDSTQLSIIFNETTADELPCEEHLYIYANQSDFGKNELYKEIFYIFTSAFGTFVPLILLATFNCFLVAAVHRSHKMRHKMTNARQNDTSTAQENKVTVTLIAVVVLFLLCQTPAAIQLIYTMHSKDFTNMDRALNNLCNFLVTLNAACNFLLYCALSDKYRKTVKQLFLGKKIMIRQNTMSSSRYSGQTTGTSIYNRSPSTPRNNSSIVRNRLQAINKTAGAPVGRFSITPSDYANFTREIDKQRANAQSLKAADYVTDANRKGSSTTEIPMKLLSIPTEYNHDSSSGDENLNDQLRRHSTSSHQSSYGNDSSCT